MRVVTWNVNSVRARMERLLPWLADRRPDVVLLQETKVKDEDFPRELLEDAGYQVVIHGQPRYNGVAVLSRRRIDDAERGLGDDGEDQRRVLTAVVGGVHFVNVYVVNGKEVGDPAYDFKLRWLDRLRAFLRARFDPVRDAVVVAGDFNVTFDDRDVHDPEAWRGKILCSEAEREALGRIVDLGYRDAFRTFHEEGELFTWWDFRTRAFRRNAGLRIDHLLVTEPALARCRDAWVDLEARQGERPSDHAPVFLELQD